MIIHTIACVELCDARGVKSAYVRVVVCHTVRCTHFHVNIGAMAVPITLRENACAISLTHWTASNEYTHDVYTQKTIYFLLGVTHG